MRALKRLGKKLKSFIYRLLGKRSYQDQLDIQLIKYYLEGSDEREKMEDLTGDEFIERLKRL